MAGAFVINRADGSQQKVAGYKFRAPHPSTKKYAASSGQKLPPKVDLRPHLTPIEDQGELSSCVANAVAGAYQYLVKRHNEEDYAVSRLFIYYNARAKEDATDQDEGSVIADAIQGLKEQGACSEETWPYDEDQVNEEPSKEAYDEGKEFLVEDMALVPVKLDAWKGALAEGYPIVFGLALYDSFDKQKQKGMVPMPSPKEAARASHSGHSMLCVGYSDPDQVFIIRNSWGTDWGDKGYCYIPYDYLMNPKYNDGDCWIIRQLTNLDVDHDTWGDDSSLIGDIDSEIAKMSDEDYQEMLEAMGKLHLETRLAIIFLACAGADGDVTADELKGIEEYVEALLEELDSNYDAGKVLAHARKHLDKHTVDESIKLFGEHVPQTMLASMEKSLREIVGEEDVTKEEEAFLAKLVEAWQVEEGDDDEDDDDDDEDDDDDDEDDDEDDDDDGDEEEEEAPKKKKP